MGEEAGALFDKILAGVFGLSRADIQLVTVSRGVPLDLQAALAGGRPRVLLLLGAVATRALLPNGGLERGAWTTVQLGEEPVQALASFHPSFLLEHPDKKRAAFGDLTRVKGALAPQPATV
jgi:DNA polymerase